MENKLLLTKEERDNVANSIPVEEYATSTQYWSAIIEAEIEAQFSKIIEAGFKKLRDIDELYPIDWLNQWAKNNGYLSPEEVEALKIKMREEFTNLVDQINAINEAKIEEAKK